MKVLHRKTVFNTVAKIFSIKVMVFDLYGTVREAGVPIAVPWYGTLSFIPESHVNLVHLLRYGSNIMSYYLQDGGIAFSDYSKPYPGSSD